MTPVYFEHFEIGRIHADKTGITFAYHPRWLNTKGAFPISLSMPLSELVSESEIVVPWLANLLPEEQNLLTIGRNLGISPQDTIGLLEHIGRDLAGAISIGSPRIRGTADYRFIDDADTLLKIIRELPAKPFLAGDDGVSMSLAGVQEKLPVAMINERMAIPINGAASTHILKPDSERLHGSIQNEALCLTLARLCDLEVANVATGKAGDRSYLLVERYDRKEGERATLRIHQEDFCQAMSKLPATKYENNRTGIKGPPLVDLFHLIDEQMTAVDTNKLLNAVIFNVLICNTDSHAKNYSILLSDGEPRLAPLYDLMCGAVWDGITQNLTQTIGGKNRGSHIHARHWKRMAASCGLSETMVVERVADLAGRIGKVLDAASDEVKSMAAGNHPMLLRFQEAIEARCRTVSGNLID